jgi:hypothetical protein
LNKTLDACGSVNNSLSVLFENKRRIHAGIYFSGIVVHGKFLKLGVPGFYQPPA